MTIAAIYQALVICQTADIVNPHINPCKTSMIDSILQMRKPKIRKAELDLLKQQLTESARKQGLIDVRTRSRG